MSRLRSACLFMALPLSATLALASGGVHSLPQAEVPSFPARVEMVTVEVVVADAKGRPVAGLSRGDFALTEDGKPQVLSTFEAIDVPEQTTTPPPGRTVVSTNVRTDSPVSRGRWFGLVLDDLHLEQREVQYAGPPPSGCWRPRCERATWSLSPPRPGTSGGLPQ